MVCGERIKAARKREAMSQTQLAEKIGVKQKDISRWENSEFEPSAGNICKLCVALNVSADSLLGLETREDKLEHFCEKQLELYDKRMREAKSYTEKQENFITKQAYEVMLGELNEIKFERK